MAWNKWVNWGYFTPINKDITRFITGRGYHIVINVSGDNLHYTNMNPKHGGLEEKIPFGGFSGPWKLCIKN